jgi:undecaprenyl-diphosphatase
LWLSRAGLFFAAFLISGGFLYFFKWLIVRNGKQFLSIAASLGHSVKQAVMTNEHVDMWIQKHPRSTSFLRERFNTTEFSGLPLSILALAFVYVMALFGGIVEDLITSDPIIAADIRIANLFSHSRTIALTNVFTWITLLGKSSVILVFILIAVILLWVWRKRFLILPLFVTVIGSSIFTFLGKLAFHRSRPEMAVYIEPSFSFPSGHATIAVAFYDFVAYVLTRQVQSWRRKVNIFFLTMVWIIAIGISRV